MKILLIGGTGNISSSITKRCLEQGHEVFLLNRGNNRELEKYGAKYIICDANDTDEMKEKVGGVHFDVVANFYCSEEAVKGCRAIPWKHSKLMISISSCTVYQKPCYLRQLRRYTLKNPPCLCKRKIAVRCTCLTATAKVIFSGHCKPSHTYGEKNLLWPTRAGAFPIGHWLTVSKQSADCCTWNRRSLWTAA